MNLCLSKEELEEPGCLFWMRGYRIAVFTDIKGCHVGERFDLFCMTPEGRAGASGASFGSV